MAASGKKKKVSSYLSRLPNYERTNFDKSLETNTPYQTKIWNRGDTVSVRAIGHISPEQFKQSYKPNIYHTDWDKLDLHPDFQTSVDYPIDDLVSSMKEHGVVKPVIAFRQNGMISDGHHRAFAAIKAGVDIPVVHFTEDFPTIKGKDD